MRGSATFTTVASRTSISWATRTIAMPVAARPAFGGQLGWAGPVRVGWRVVTVIERHGGAVLFWPGGPRYTRRRMTPVPAINNTETVSV